MPTLILAGHSDVARLAEMATRMTQPSIIPAQGVQFKAGVATAADHGMDPNIRCTSSGHEVHSICERLGWYATRSLLLLLNLRILLCPIYQRASGKFASCIFMTKQVVQKYHQKNVDISASIEC